MPGLFLARLASATFDDAEAGIRPWLVYTVIPPE